MTKPMTRALHLRVDDAGARPLVTPLYQNSAFEAGSPYFYTRKDNPNVQEFEQVMATLEEARFAVGVSTGMAAISAVLDMLRPGETLVVNRLVYGCSLKLMIQVAEARGVKLVLEDLTDVRALFSLPQDVRMVFFETPTNPFLRTVDIARVSHWVKKSNPRALVVVDNTWATPLNQRPLAHGADISLHSATKYISGHSDVMGGFLLTDREDLHQQLRDHRFYHGAVLDPHSAWLLRRSVQTLGVRMRHHRELTGRMVELLQTRPEITQVFHPVLDAQLPEYGGILFATLRHDLVEQYPDLVKKLKLFSTGTGMACVTSMIARPYDGSHASLSPEEKQTMGIGRDLIRLCFGLEDFEDLAADLERGLTAIAKPTRSRARSAG